MSKSKNEIRATYHNAPEPATPTHIPDGTHNVSGYMHVAVPSDNSTYSFELQESYLRRYISEQPAWNLVKIYQDAGKDHAALDHIIGECQSNLVDLIVVKSISRMSRNLIKTIELIRQFKDYDIGIYFLDEDFYTLDSKYDLCMELIESFAMDERLSKSYHSRTCLRYIDGKFHVVDRFNNHSG